MRPSDRLNDCSKFRGLSADDRVDFVTSKDACVKCLSWRHVRENCPVEQMKCTFKDQSGTQCAGPHHRLLHGSSKSAVINNVGVKVLNQSARDKSDPVLLCMAEVSVHNVKTSVILDGGSTVTCITDDLAKELGLSGTPVWRIVETPGRPPERKQIMEYLCLVTEALL